MKLKQQIWLTIIVVIIVMVAVIVFVLTPSIARIQEISKKIYLERADLEARYQRGLSLKKSTSEFNKNQDNFYLLSSAFIQGGEELDFLTLLEKTAKDNNIELEKKITDPKEAPLYSPNFGALTLELNVEGDFINTIQFLKKLEESDIYINFETMTINQLSSNKNSLLLGESLAENNITSNIKGLTFWQNEKIVQTPEEQEPIEEVNANDNQEINEENQPEEN